MAFYDHFLKSTTASVSQIGEKIVNFQNKFFLGLLRKHFEKENISLLEIGPGKGYFADSCSKNNIEYTAIEANKLMASKLKEKGFRVYCQRVPPICVKEKFDVVFMSQVLEHINTPLIAEELIKNCFSILREDGLIIISSPDLTVWGWDFWNGDYTHNYPTTLNRAKQLLFDNNFEIIYSGYLTFFLRGDFPTKIITYLGKLLFNLGLLKLIFGKKAEKVKYSLDRSFIVVGKKLKKFRKNVLK